MYKYGGRLLIGLITFAVFHISHSVENYGTIFYMEARKLIFMGYIILVVPVMLEWTDILIRWYTRRYKNILDNRRLFWLFVYTFSGLIPALVFATYLVDYHIGPLTACKEIPSNSRFILDIVNAMLIMFIILALKVSRLYFKQSKQLFEYNSKIQKELYLSKYESLKNQVNPHFLFNSFSVLSSLINSDPTLAEEFLGKLSRMYRYILDNQDNQMVTLDKELKFAETYMFLLKVRHEDSVVFDVDLRLNLSDYRIPTLSLQMLIENAIKHNTFSTQSPLTIRIFSEQQYVVVQNESRKRPDAVVSTKLGLENIRNRFSYETDREVVVEELKGFFTVKLPVLQIAST